MDTTVLELFLATLIMGLGLFLTRHILKSLTNTSVIDLAILSSCLFFAIGPWVAAFYGNWTLPNEDPWLLIITYFSIGLYFVGIWTMGQIGKITLVKQVKVPSFRSSSSSLKDLSNHNFISFGKPPAFRKLFFGNSVKKTKVANLSSQFSLLNLLPNLKNIQVKTIYIIYGIVWVLRIIRAVNYGILFSGTASAENIIGLPYWFVIAFSISEILGLGCLLWASITINTTRSSFIRSVARIILLLELLWFFMQGRRYLLSWLLFLIIGYVVSQTKIVFKTFAIVSLITIFIITVMFPLFLTIRTVYFSEIKSESIIEQLMSSTQEAYNQQGQIKHIEQYESNLSTRPLVSRFMTRILEKQSSPSDLMAGNALLSSIMWAIPSSILPSKIGTLKTEQLIQSNYGMKQFDTSITWPALGVSDFWILGGFFAGICVGGVILFMGYIIRRNQRNHPFLALVFLACIIYTVFQVEEDPVAYWVLLRGIFIILIIVNSFSFLTKRV